MESNDVRVIIRSKYATSFAVPVTKRIHCIALVFVARILKAYCVILQVTRKYLKLKFIPYHLSCFYLCVCCILLFGFLHYIYSEVDDTDPLFGALFKGYSSNLAFFIICYWLNVFVFISGQSCCYHSLE